MFIEEVLREQPGKRVFIHCKGGRGRAAAMAACFYMKKHAKEPKEVVTWLKAKRHVVSMAVAKYETVVKYHEHVQQSGGKR
jgi:protein-tyrosine phosphatase